MDILEEGEEMIEDPKLVVQIKVRKDCDKCHGSGTYSEPMPNDNLRTHDCRKCDDENKIEESVERIVKPEKLLDSEVY